MPGGRDGKIVTFYSYKGGTGRSMTLANVAWVLASNGKRVLAVDWDLEAPGLHRYFHPFLDDKALTASDGVIDMAVDFASAAVTPPPPPAPGTPPGVPADWYKPHANILRYATSLDWEFPDDGTVDFVPAGRQGPSYATRVNGFNWLRLYDELGGGWFIEAVKDRMRAEYDYVLIDSRTGVSDTSGICTVQMPDVLVVCFTLNAQSIDGAGTVAASVDGQRRGPDGKPGVRVVPVPMRVEKFEKERLDLAREAARERFAPLLSHLTPDDREAYWGEVEVLYEPFYAYEEILAAFGDKPAQTNSMLASVERITARITGGAVTRLAPMSEEQRLQVLSRYLRQRMPVPAATRTGGTFVFYLSYAHAGTDSYVRQFYDDLSSEIRALSGSAQSAIGFFDEALVSLGESWEEPVRAALAGSRVFVPLYSPAYFASEFCGKEFQYFLDRARAAGRGGPAQILPVLWVPTPRLPEVAAGVQLTDAQQSDTYRTEGLRYLMRLQRHQDDYREFVRRFAQTVLGAAEQPPGPPVEVPPLGQIRNAFAGAAARVAGPRSALFVFAAASADEMRKLAGGAYLRAYGESSLDWRPFLPDTTRPLTLLAGEAALAERIVFDVAPVTEELPKALDEAAKLNQPVVVFIDPWVAEIDRFRWLLTYCDRRRFLNVVTLIVWGPNEPGLVGRRLVNMLAEVMPATFGDRDPRDRKWIEDPRSLVAAVSQALVTLRGRLMLSSPPVSAGPAPSVPKPTIRGPEGGLP